MTVNELVEYIAEDLNTTSQESKTRIAHALNVRYKQVTSAIGLNPIRRETLSKAATVGNREMTFTGTEKLETVYRIVGTQKYVLTELTHDEMTAKPPRTEPPNQYAVVTTGPQSITIILDCTPTTTFTLYATALGDATTLSSNEQPAFPESFHDILVHGVKADEYRRRDKLDFSRDEEKIFGDRLSDLRMFLAKSAWLTVYRGKNQQSEGWWDTNVIRKQ